MRGEGVARWEVGGGERDKGDFEVGEDTRRKGRSTRHKS